MSFSNDPVVRVENATIFQEDKAVLSDISLTVGKGEFVYLIGRTGSGKSSLLKTLYADLPLRLGQMETAGFKINGISSKKISQLRRKIGIIFQDFELLPDRTVAENLQFVMRATGWKDRSKMKKRMADVLMQVGLGSIDNKMPYQLSGGEQQRVVIARALLNEPVLLIADEPTGNLDPEVSDGVFKLFTDINKSGTAVLMGTHDHSFIEKHPARVLKCFQGKLLDSQKEEFDLRSNY
ncbi:ATP-binding cassette domain-containing protein [Marivirga atlantica]|jgi:cell division transport system ATP-binding protein|uniref:ATP-binding cassette domain-containing protein n=1 Tax=Marivirga atlantica TaxID=1548457 RepID=A0A937A9M1_9BACT|nr:ATP-binding cassette domain-containing protein [Marivirga atlantica]MBL0764861.1 ATP-binding cassette domain-containing protein [Marivirga atlantica]